MVPRIATAYDQNPTRIRLAAGRRRRPSRPVWQAFIGIQLLVGLAAVYFWNYLPA
jgi:hypothetical protein